MFEQILPSDFHVVSEITLAHYLSQLWQLFEK
jgi:hypothetical protein